MKNLLDNYYFHNPDTLDIETDLEEIPCVFGPTFVGYEEGFDNPRVVQYLSHGTNLLELTFYSLYLTSDLVMKLCKMHNVYDLHDVRGNLGKFIRSPTHLYMLAGENLKYVYAPFGAGVHMNAREFHEPKEKYIWIKWYHEAESLADYSSRFWEQSTIDKLKDAFNKGLTPAEGLKTLEK